MIEEYGEVTIMLDEDKEPIVLVRDFHFNSPYEEGESISNTAIKWAIEILEKNLRGEK